MRVILAIVQQLQRFYLRRPLNSHFFFQVFNLWTDGSPYSGETRVITLADNGEARVQQISWAY